MTQLYFADGGTTELLWPTQAFLMGQARRLRGLPGTFPVTDDTRRRMIIQLDNTPIGEMSYENMGNGRVEIGIKICDTSKQEKGYGRILLSMLFSELFYRMNYKVIMISTDTENLRAQHVYELLGAERVRTLKDAWTDPTGKVHSFVEYELIETSFVNFAV